MSLYSDHVLLKLAVSAGELLPFRTSIRRMPEATIWSPVVMNHGHSCCFGDILYSVTAM